MSTISYDGQSFMVAGRRIWLVSGSIHYARTPRTQWRSRLRAAREAGLNCIDTYVFWNLHEPKPGEFNFQDDLDLRAFIQMIGEEGMYCILRPGPYICAEWDNGGLPVWLSQISEMKLRQSSGPFLEACARYLGAVMQQVRDLQITAPVHGKPTRASQTNLPGQVAGGFAGTGATGGGGGPIILIQAENEWICHNPDEAEAYLRQIVRYLRENGCEVPNIVCNQLWQRVEGTIDTWNGSGHLTADLRQLGVVQRDAPRLMTEYWSGWFDSWGGKHSDKVDAGKHLYRLAGILAAGAQYNLYMFHGGTNFGFFGGRTVGQPSKFMTTSYDYDAPLLEAGGRAAKYAATKRISTFASQFHHVLAALEPDGAHAAAALNETDHPLSVIHQHGSQGDVVFLLRAANDKGDHADVLLPDGLTLPVDLGTDRAAWLLLHAKLGGATELTYTNLRPWAFLNHQMLILFGPAGTRGLVSINDVPMEIQVPKDASPAVEHHEGLTVVVLSGEQVDAGYLCEQGLAVWCAGLDENGEPIPLGGSRAMQVIALDGTIQTIKGSTTRKPTAPRLGEWAYASVASLIDGTSPDYQTIDGPTSLDALGCDYGYGWYRIPVTKSRGNAIVTPHGQDRLHIYCKGRLKAILGEGAGAKDAPVDMTLEDEIVVLADNLGRCNCGYRVGEQKGVLDHFYVIKPVKLGKARVIAERAPDPFELSGFVLRRRKGDRPPSEALVWKIKPTGRKPILWEMHDFPVDATIFVNGHPVANYPSGLCVGKFQVVLDPASEFVTGGQNEVKLALHTPWDRSLDPLKYIHAYQTTAALSARGSWAFCRWTTPKEDTFTNLPRSTTGGPAWFRARFFIKTTRVPLWLEPRGMSKGQIYLNGHNVGRYWVATDSGAAVPPQKRYYLPEAWLHEDKPNELLIFDEHGKSPAKAKLVYDALGPYNA